MSSEDGDDRALLAEVDYAAALLALKAGDAAAVFPRLRAALKRLPDAGNLRKPGNGPLIPTQS